MTCCKFLCKVTKLESNDRTIPSSVELVNAKKTTARLALNDRTIELQRPHNLPPTTARFRRPVRMSFQRLEIPLGEVK